MRFHHGLQQPIAKADVSGYKQGKGGKMHAAGSRGASYSGPSLVGEEGVELAYNKSTSSMRLLGSNGPEVTNIASGERILNHSDTKSCTKWWYGARNSFTRFP